MSSDDWWLRGFLGPETIEVEKQILDRHGRLHAVFDRVNVKAVSFQHRLEPNSEDLRGLVAVCLYAQLLSNVQAAVILLQRGMKVQASAMLRVSLETLYYLAAVSEQENFAERFIKTHPLDQKRSLKNIERWNEPPTIDVKEQEERIQAEIEALGSKRIRVQDAADAAGLLQSYYSEYMVLSWSVHPTPRTLQEAHVVSDESLNIKGLKNGPDIDQLEGEWVLSTRLLLQGIEYASELFGLDMKDFIESESAAVRDITESRPDGTSRREGLSREAT